MEFLATIQTPKNPVFVTVGEHDYAVKADGTLGEPIRKVLLPQFTKPTLKVATLTALAAACIAKVDGFGEDVALHVTDFLTVQLVSTKADEYGRRHVYIEAKHQVETPFKFNTYLAAEDFQIALRTSFLLNDEAVKVLTVASNLESGQQISVGDDGLSQKIEVKIGTVSKTSVTLPSDGIPLIPWRTFRDADPVESKFLLRLQQVKDDLPKVALFEIDQKWKLDTIQSIANWIKTNIPLLKVIA